MSAYGWLAAAAALGLIMVPLFLVLFGIPDEQTLLLIAVAGSTITLALCTWCMACWQMRC